MTKDEILKLALEALDGGHIDRAYGYIQEALAQREMRKATREEKISNPGVYEVPVQPEQEPDIAEIEKIMLEVWQPVSPEQDGECKHCTDGCPACDATKLTKDTHDLL